jgi:hypothetical protein
MNPQQPYSQQDRQHSRQFARLLLTPSWITVVTSVVLALVTTAILFFQGYYQGSDLQQQFLQWRTTTDSNSPSSAASSLQHSTAGVVGYIELFIFWYAVGTVAYLLGVAIYRTIRSANETRQDSYFVNMSRSAFLRALYLRLAVRFVSVAGWVGYAVLTLKLLLPYLLGALHVADEHFPSAGAFGLLIGSNLGLLLVIHVHVIFLRLSLGRPRVFHMDEYVIGLS